MPRRTADRNLHCGQPRGQRLDKGPTAGDVDHLSRDHVVSNPGQAGHIGRDWNTRVLKPAVDAGDIADLTGIVEGEGDSADFDDFVAAVIEARSFSIKDDALPKEPGLACSTTSRRGSRRSMR